MSRPSAQIMMRQARAACDAVAVGPYTPVVMYRAEYINGSMGAWLGHPSETLSGHGCIIWDEKPVARQAAKVAS